jgi:hypothetical protein
MSDDSASRFAQWGRRILPQPTDDLLKGTWEKHLKARDLLGQIKASPKLKDRPEVHKQIDDLSAKHQEAGQLLQKIRYSAEYRYELKRMALQPDQIKSLIPSYNSPWGQPPLFVVGVIDQEGKRHLFQRPIRTTN